MDAEERRRIIELIREQLTDTIAEPTDDDCIDFALRCGEREVAGKPKPRHPRNKW